MSASIRPAIGAFSVWAFLFAAAAWAQPPASVIPPNPQSPTINLPQPTGAQPGTSVELTLGGGNLMDPVTVLTGFRAKVSFPSDTKNPNTAAKLRVRFEIDPAAKVGMYPIRLVTKQGISNPRPFCIDDLPVGPGGSGNRSISTAVSMPVPSVASGQIDQETSEFFRINVNPGQRVCMEVLARRLGSTLDPIILIRDGKTGQEIPSLYSDDSPGCQTDCRLTHTFKNGGEYLIEVRDSTHRGGPDFWYRLRVGDFPSAITPMPLAAKRGMRATIGFAGPDLVGVPPQTVDIPADPGLSAISLVPKGSRPHSGWPVSLLLSDRPEILEQEPNNEPAKANRVPVPCGISGGFQEKSDHDCFVFSAKKGQRFLINAQTQELLSPADVYMVLKNAKGAGVATNNPQTGAGIDYTAPADEDLTLVLEHLNYLNGPNEVYHLTITHPEPGLDVTLATNRIEIPANGSAPLPIQTLVRRDYAGPVEVSVVGMAGLTGSTTITAAGPPAPNLPIGVLTITHSGKPLSGEIRIQAKATVNGKEIRSFASVTAVVVQEMAGLPFPPHELSNAIALATIEPPFRIFAKYAFTEGVRGMPLNLTVTATRATGFAEDIVLSVVNLPPNVAAAAKPIAKGANEAVFPISPAPNAPVGTFEPIIIGRGKFQGRDFTVSVAAPLTLEAASFELKASSPSALKPGDKAKLKVTAIRKGGYDGPIDLELKNLPAGVSAAKTTIAAGKNDVEIELSVAASATPAEKGDVIVSGSAAGQRAASAAFKVSVVKK
jgi:hypothetical protein